VDVRLEFNLMTEHGENYYMDSNQPNNGSEGERDGDYQYDVDNNKEINVEKFEPSH